MKAYSAEWVSESHIFQTHIPNEMIVRKRHLLFIGALLFNLTSCSQFKDQVQSTSSGPEVASAALACPLSQSTFVPTDSDDFELVFQDQSTDSDVEEPVDLTHRDRGVEFRFGFLRQEPDLYDWALVAVGIPGPASDITATPVFPIYAYDAQMRPTRTDEQVKYIFVEGLGDFYPQVSTNPEFSADELRGKVWIKTCRTEAAKSSSNPSKLEVSKAEKIDPIGASNLI